MDTLYEVCDTYEGKNKLFKNKDDAKKHSKDVKSHLHTTYCIDKDVPSKCLCTWSKGEKICAAHHYAHNVEYHKLKHCQLANGSVFVEEKLVN